MYALERCFFKTGSLFLTVRSLSVEVGSGVSRGGALSGSVGVVLDGGESRRSTEWESWSGT